MADTKISALTDGDPAQSGDEIPVARSGTNYKVTAGSIASLATGMSLLDTQVFSASTTYTMPTGAQFVIVECVGAGAGGQSAYWYGAGGAGGGYWRELLNADELGGSVTVTIGQGGVGGDEVAQTFAGPGGESRFGPLYFPGTTANSGIDSDPQSFVTSFISDRIQYGAFGNVPQWADAGTAASQTWKMPGTNGYYDYPGSANLIPVSYNGRKNYRGGGGGGVGDSGGGAGEGGESVTTGLGLWTENDAYDFYVAEEGGGGAAGIDGVNNGDGGDGTGRSGGGGGAQTTTGNGGNGGNGGTPGGGGGGGGVGTASPFVGGNGGNGGDAQITIWVYG